MTRKAYYREACRQNARNYAKYLFQKMINNVLVAGLRFYSNRKPILPMLLSRDYEP